MILDFYHNKIVSDTVSEGFISSFSETLMPKLVAKYGEKLLGIQMYEDFINDNLVNMGFAYYPLTVILADSFEVVWIRWSIENEADFKGGIPYSYIGESPIYFDLLETAPDAFSHVTDGRRMYFDGSTLPIHINTVIDSIKLSGKYSQTFLDELAYAVSREIEAAMAVSGLSGTGIRFEMPFAPETYMEHTSDNVTYRRILISDKTSSAKDLWIKWTRLDSAVGYSVSDNVSSENIVFELGEDVSQKVREKEYRFLTRISASKYQAAMGRKNVTEWRELIKRAIKRGELVRRELPPENEAKAGEVNDELDRILEKIGYAVPDLPKAEPVPTAPDDELLRAIQIAEQTVMASGEQADADEPSFMPEGLSLEIEKGVDDEPEEEAESAEEIEEEIEEETEEEIEEADDEPIEETDSDEDDGILPWEDRPSESEDEDEPCEQCEGEADESEYDFDDTARELVTEDGLSDIEAEEKLLLSELLKLDSNETFDEDESEAEDQPDEEDEPDEIIEITEHTPRYAVADDSESINRIKAEKAQLEAELRLKIEEEIERRRGVEAELSAALRECDRLLSECERANMLYEKAVAEKVKAGELHESEKQQLMSEIATLRLAEERERSRLAEAAIAEMEERRRTAEEAERAELERRRLAEERQRQLEAEREAAEREAERERIIRETAQKREAATIKESVIYTSYVVRLLFRHSVDPNSINQIGELIKTTVAYYKKDELKIRVKASIPDSMTVQLDFTNIPDDEHELIVNIIKVLGNSNLGIAKAILD